MRRHYFDKYETLKLIGTVRERRHYPFVKLRSRPFEHATDCGEADAFGRIPATKSEWPGRTPNVANRGFWTGFPRPPRG